MTTGPFKDHFSARSAEYAAFRPHYPAALADYLAGLVEAHDLALDCGCGSGQLSTLLADRFGQVEAIDASASQIAKGVPHERVTYRQARAEATGLAGRSADLATVAQAAHWLDLDAFYAEMRRVLKPSGALALITYGVPAGTGEAGAVLAKFYGDVLNRYWPPGREHVTSGYRTLPFPFAEEDAPEMVLEADWPLDGWLGYLGTLSSAMRAEAELGPAPFEAFAAELAAVWGDPEAARSISWPLRMRIGRP